MTGKAPRKHQTRLPRLIEQWQRLHGIVPLPRRPDDCTVIVDDRPLQSIHDDLPPDNWQLESDTPAIPSGQRFTFDAIANRDSGIAEPSAVEAAEIEAAESTVLCFEPGQFVRLCPVEEMIVVPIGKRAVLRWVRKPGCIDRAAISCLEPYVGDGPLPPPKPQQPALPQEPNYCVRGLAALDRFLDVLRRGLEPKPRDVMPQERVSAYLHRVR
jgi:hypothetical protein